jgi:hypothetical protein
MRDRRGFTMSSDIADERPKLKWMLDRPRCARLRLVRS